ncbi:hypothetical protein GIB67_019937 [Kingdonia uniflora]|uniref:Uncharacterized protein n=1 Tax=Kingdonia uniflora TaxID=39325 RepID=A0A7J7MKL3_9MAGN|nr:hypothetical protein GIB67_019937 [Kingdonia uniflora]
MIQESSSSGANWRKIKGQFLQSASNGRQLSRKQFVDSPSVSDSKSTEATTSVSVDELSGVDSAAMPSISREVEGAEYPRQPPSTASSALIELTTRLDFFKERRSQLMEQLHNLDINYKTPSPTRDLIYKQSSPPWS